MTRSMLGQVGRYAALPAKRGQIARSLQAGPCLPGGLLRSIRSQRGLGMMLAADAMLFGWCLLASLALDFGARAACPVAWAAGRGCVRTGLWPVLGGALADDAENRVYPADAAQRRDMDGSGCIFDFV